ncbi:hypothetical protein ACFPRL_00905 [Pseudoclavibacter helvolus]
MANCAPSNCRGGTRSFTISAAVTVGESSVKCSKRPSPTESSYFPVTDARNGLSRSYRQAPLRASRAIRTVPLSHARRHAVGIARAASRGTPRGVVPRSPRASR